MNIDALDTPRDLEREADASREELSETLDTLKDKLTPGKIFDDMFGGSSANAGAFLKNLGTSMRDQPMPALLIGAGLVMMLSGGGKGRSSTSETSSVGYGQTRTHSVADGARAAAHDMRDGVESASKAVGDALSSVGEKVANVAGGLADSASRSAGSMSSGSRAASHKAGQLGALVSDQPIIAASIGLALGAVLAAAIPSTEAENSLMGSASDELKQQAADVLSQKADAVGDAASTIARDVLDEAENQGLSTGDALQSASTFADKVGAVADKATSSMERESKKLL